MTSVTRLTVELTNIEYGCVEDDDDDENKVPKLS